MLKRLIEVSLPLIDISERSATEKSIKQGHIASLHIWWARRPLAACRAIVFASLIPDPDDPECLEDFRKLIQEILGSVEFKPKNIDGTGLEDTPRNRCLEFIKHLVRWENSNNTQYIEPACQLIKTAHKFLNPSSDTKVPRVLDPFAGGGAIPLEAQRLGCESHALDLNPVAHLIQLCTLVYPQKYGQPDSRPVPDYIMRLVAHNRVKRQEKGEAELFDSDELSEMKNNGLVPEIEITEAEYRKNPLAADVKYWGYWVFHRALADIGDYYPQPKNGHATIAFLWARTVECPNPACRATIPLIRQLWLSKKRKISLRLTQTKDKVCTFSICEGKSIDFDPHQGTTLAGKASCPFCGHVADGNYLKSKSKAGKIGQQLLAVVEPRLDGKGKAYRSPNSTDEDQYRRAVEQLQKLQSTQSNWSGGLSLLPDEPISKQQPRVLFVQLYGLDKWCDLFNDRQLLALVSFGKAIREVIPILSESGCDHSYTTAVVANLALCLTNMSHYLCTSATWLSEGMISSFILGGNIPMKMDYAECNPLGRLVGSWQQAVEKIIPVIERLETNEIVTQCRQASATKPPFTELSIDAVITDPPYYDQIPYAECADFFYVWHRRLLGDLLPDLGRLKTPYLDQILCPVFGPGHLAPKCPYLLGFGIQ